MVILGRTLLIIISTHTGCVSGSSYQFSSVFLLISGYSLDNLHCFDDSLNYPIMTERFYILKLSM